MNFDSSLNESLKAVFKDYKNSSKWEQLKEILSFNDYRIIYPKSVNFKNTYYEEITSELEFENFEHQRSFLKHEIDLAINMQEYDLAAKLRDLFNNQSQNEIIKISFYLKYSLKRLDGNKCEFQFETDFLSFKYQLIREFSLSK